MAFELEPFVRRIREENLNVHGIAVQQHGALLGAHRFSEDMPHTLHSASKTFLSTGIGMLSDEGRLSLDDRVMDFFPDKLPDPVPMELAALTIHHLLIMSAGRDKKLLMYQTPKEITDWVRYYLSLPFDRMPGARFRYDSGCTYILSAIITRITGETALDYLYPRLFAPLGITEKPQWDTCPMGITLGGAGLFLRTMQLLPLGQLYLDGGMYKGKRVVSEDYVNRAMTRHSESRSSQKDEREDWHSGYGYQLWLCANGCRRASGALGQYIIISKEKDAVIALNSTEIHQQDILHAVWDTVYSRL